MSNFRYLQDLPKPQTEVTKCRQFLAEFGQGKYLHQLTEIADRQRKELVIELDDVIAVSVKAATCFTYSTDRLEC